MVNISNLFTKANQAIEKRNFEYAIEMLIQCISLDPDNLEARKTLRSTARHMLKEKGAKSSSKLKSAFGGFKGLFSQKLKKDPEKAMIDYEKSLIRDPNNAHLLRSLGNAAVEANHIETAVWIFTDAQKIAPDNKKILWDLTKVYELNSDIKNAQETCQKILDIDPSDGEAARKIKSLAAKETIQTGRYDHAQSFRDSLKSEQAQDDFEIKEKILRTEEDVRQAIDFRKRQLENEPDATRIMMTLGDLYKRLKNWDEAGKWYDKAFELDKADFTIQFKQGDLIIDRMQDRLDQIKTMYQNDKSNTELKEQYRKLSGELNKIKLEEYQKRVKAQPTVGRHHFNLGEHMFKLKQYRDAIAEFQKVSHDPEFRLPSLNYLGQCFHTLKNYDLSEKQFLEALEKRAVINEKVKPLIYNLGRLYIDMDKKEEAIIQLNRIYEVDINYKDVADLITKLKA